MRTANSLFLLSGLVLICGTSWHVSVADEPAPRAEPPAVSKDEPIRPGLSVEKAVQFLDTAAIAWTENRKCFSCHTNYAYLYARPMVAHESVGHGEVRKALEKLVEKNWKEKGPRWDAEVITAGAALAFHDRATTGKLHPLTQVALDRIWTIQRDDGGFRWLKCGWPPMELDDHYGVTLAALAVGFAPGDYSKSEQAVRGLEKIRAYLKANPAQSVHNEAMVLWASAYHEGFLTAEEKQAIVSKIFALQRADGGWAMAALGPWKRGDDKEQDLETSDGYGTGFAIYVLRKSGVSATDARIAKGVEWLQSHQRESGRWFTRSAFKDNKHFISNAGTAFAVMALAECNALK